MNLKYLTFNDLSKYQINTNSLVLFDIDNTIIKYNYTIFDFILETKNKLKILGYNENEISISLYTLAKENYYEYILTFDQQYIDDDIFTRIIENIIGTNSELIFLTTYNKYYIDLIKNKNGNNFGNIIKKFNIEHLFNLFNEDQIKNQNDKFEKLLQKLNVNMYDNIIIISNNNDIIKNFYNKLNGTAYNKVNLVDFICII